MSQKPSQTQDMSIFERYLTLWVVLCIMTGISLGQTIPNLATALDGFAIYIGDAPVVSIPIHSVSVFHDVPDHGQDRLQSGSQYDAKPVAHTFC